jgi:rRNA pseudouridine-1189 N-methylase Emg1 (Nep1/Mra1 family)
MTTELFELQKGDPITATVIFGGVNKGYFHEMVNDKGEMYVRYTKSLDQKSSGVYLVKAENVTIGHDS